MKSRSLVVHLLCVSALALCTGCVASSLTLGRRTSTREVNSMQEKMYPVTTVELALGEPSQPGKSEVSASVKLLPDLSRLAPTKGSEPEFLGYATLMVTLLNTGPRSRDFDVVVGFPNAGEALIQSGTRVEELGYVTSVVAQPGTSTAVQGLNRSPVRLYPDIETSAFVRVAVPNGPQKRSVSGFIGLFDTSPVAESKPLAFRFPFTVTGTPEVAVYRATRTEQQAVELVRTRTFDMPIFFPSLQLRPKETEDEDLSSWRVVKAESTSLRFARFTSLASADKQPPAALPALPPLPVVSRPAPKKEQPKEGCGRLHGDDALFTHVRSIRKCTPVAGSASSIAAGKVLKLVELDTTGKLAVVADVDGTESSVSCDCVEGL